MTTRSREDREPGPRPLSGVRDSGTSGELPAVDMSVGAKQRYRVHVPTEDTTLLLGARVPVTRDEDATKQLGYDGVNAITNGHLFFASSTQTATMQSSGRVYIVSLTSSLSALAKGEVVIGSDKSSATLAAKTAVSIISGYGPLPQTVTLYGETPESPSTPNLENVVEDHGTAALVAGGVITVITTALGIIGTPRAAWASSIAAYTLQTIGLLSGFKAIAEGSSRKTVLSGFGDDLPAGVGIHGKDGVTITSGISPGSSVTMFAPVGSVTGIGGLTAGLVGGLSANISGILSASVSGLAQASMQALNKASVVSLAWSSLDSRVGTSTVRGATVEIGQVTTITPQLPTVATTVQGLMKVDAKVGLLGLTALELNGLLGQMSLKAVKKIALEVLPYTVEVSPLGVSIKASGVPVVSITPTKITLMQLASKLEIAPTGVKVVSGPTSVDLSAASAKIAGLKVLLG